MNRFFLPLFFFIIVSQLNPLFHLHRQSINCQKERWGRKNEICHDITENKLYICKKDYCNRENWKPLLKGKIEKA